MSETTKIFYTKTSVGNRHWVTGEAYPENDGSRYDPPRIMDFAVDAFAVYGAPAPNVGRRMIVHGEDEQQKVQAESHSETLTGQESQQEEPQQVVPHWGVHVTDPPEGTGHWFNVEIPSDSLIGSEYYVPLVEALEARLGRTGLMVLVH